MPSEHATSLEVTPSVRWLRRAGMFGALLLLLVVFPVFNLLGWIEPTDLNRLSRYLCFAIAALGIDLVWGYAGALSLCQALFFCMGGYAIAMHLSLPEGGGDVRPEYNNIPQFFFFNDVSVLPDFWQPFSALPFALFMALLLPVVAATVFGLIIFRSRVRGVYFAIITQAVALATFLSFCRNEMLLGGTNGLTNFYKPMNREPGWILGFYLATVVVLILCFLLCRFITKSRLGLVLVAVRDNEMRLNFAGYRPDMFKVFAFAAAALMAAIGGVLYVPQNGIITPNIMRVEDSIVFVVCVALGGRGKLWGAVAGTLVYWMAYSRLTSDLPRAWPFVFGGIVVAVVVYLPSGIQGLWLRVEQALRTKAGIGAVLRSGGPLLAIGLFIVVEAAGLMPGFMQTLIFDVHLKYLVMVGVLVLCAVLPWLSNLRPVIATSQSPAAQGTAD